MAVTPQEAARRLENAGFSFADRYEQGTQGKGQEWESGARRGEDNYKTGVQRALQEGAFGKGVQRAGASRYEQGVQNKGVNNWPTGMQTAGDRYQEGVQPFTSLWDQELSTKRGARRSSANIQRVQENIQRFIRAAGGSNS